MARKAPLSGLLIEVAGYYTYPESTPGCEEGECKEGECKEVEAEEVEADPGAFEAALALLARRVEHRGLQASAPLVALRALRGPERLAVLSPTLPGIARLGRSAALLAASGSMIGASIEGCPKRGQPTEGKNGSSPAV